LGHGFLEHLDWRAQTLVNTSSSCRGKPPRAREGLPVDDALSTLIEPRAAPAIPTHHDARSAARIRTQHGGSRIGAAPPATRMRRAACSRDRHLGLEGQGIRGYSHCGRAILIPPTTACSVRFTQGCPVVGRVARPVGSGAFGPSGGRTDPPCFATREPRVVHRMSTTPGRTKTSRRPR